MTVNGTPVDDDARTRATCRLARAVAGRRHRGRSSCRCRCDGSSRNEQVEADRDRVALQRGPIVFAAEWPDNPGGRVRNLVIADDEPLRSEFRRRPAGRRRGHHGPCRGVRDVRRRRQDRRDAAVHRDPVFRVGQSRAGRDGGVDGAHRRVRAGPRLRRRWPRAPRSTASPSRRLPRFINDGEEPASSDDPTLYFDWWPTKGTTEWVEMTLAAKARVSEVEVYWFDDTGHGQVRVPASWRLLYKNGDQLAAGPDLRPVRRRHGSLQPGQVHARRDARRCGWK